MTAFLGELHAGKAAEAQAAAAKAQITAKYAGLPLTVVADDASSSASLELGGGASIGGGRDGNAIAKYIAHVGGGALYPRPPFGAASRHRASTIDAWLDFSASRVAHRFAASVESAQTPKDLEAAKEQLLTDLAGMDSHLQAQTFLVGDAPSLADVALAVDLRPAFEKVLDPAARQRVPHVARWIQTVTAQPHFAQVLGSISLAERTFEPPAVAANAARAAAGKAEAERKKAQRAAQAKSGPGADAKPAKAPKPGKAPQQQDAGKDQKKETKLGLSAKKATDFGDWYSQVVVESEMISYYDVSGCYILRPWAYGVWEHIHSWFDGKIKAMGVKNAYFPIFITEESLNTEKDHVEGFAAEVAWVTRSGQSELERPIAIRPTSETVMYPYYAKWIKSHRDLPLRLNQWNAVVRWEFKHPTPFIRSREFLWQEGHTAFATKAEAEAEVLQIQDLYAGIYEYLLAVPVCKGKKSEAEKFAGAAYTTTVEAFVPATGRGIQGGTSHCLGQNFSKMFGIEFETEEGGKALAWQNSWGLTTRTIGVAVMIHGDDKGMVMPPRVSPTQLIVIPIPSAKLSADVRAALTDRARELAAELTAAGVRTDSDLRDNYTPGWKYNYWELKGVPIRMELGPKDLEAKAVVLARRDMVGVKETVAWADVARRVPELLEQIQADMLARARAEFDSCIERALTWDDFMAALDRKHMVLAPWCDEEEVEEGVRKRSASGDAMGAKTLCIPLEQPDLPEGTQCFVTGKPAKNWALWGRSY